MTRWKVILAAALIFASGVVTGALAYRFILNRPQPARPPSLGPGLLDSRSDLLQHMRKELNLTGSQADRIDAILREGRSRVRQVWDTCQPQFREEMKRIRESIHAELNPDQQARFDDLYKHSKNRDRKPDGERSDPRDIPPTSTNVSHAPGTLPNEARPWTSSPGTPSQSD